ncbi:hypothetical protein LOC54_06865 [Acetobacter sp. AN02]|uniref:hypothetical protein n=1 Tax=Acetobacter sp. AN02 TaxID=2894186 RepID=UPI002434413D|nr:hypothetical protein [Acetobacter sp. AN02]MDG6094832.1 hypothetical protein [Acetobacter sp. AN02]
MSRTRFYSAAFLSLFCLAPAAYAAGCTQSGTGALGRLASKEDCLNQKALNWQQKSAENQAARQQKLNETRDKYLNAPEREREKLQSKIQSQQDKLNATREKYANAPEREREKLQSKIQSQQDKLNAARSGQEQRIQNMRNSAAQDRAQASELRAKTRSDLSNLTGGMLNR